MWKIIVCIVFYAPFISSSSDRTDLFHQYYARETVLTISDLNRLSNIEIVLVPGIISESFPSYFMAQFNHYNNFGLSVSKIKSSSSSVQDTLFEIDSKIRTLRSIGKEVVFITHSLGGLVLLDWIMNHGNDYFDVIKGAIFIQSPFYGAPLAGLYLKDPYYARTVLGPILPFFNTSMETIRYLSPKMRSLTMRAYAPQIQELLARVSVVTVGGITTNHQSIFRPAANLIAYGCLTWIRGKCRSRVIYQGPYDNSDGMVPFSSSLLPGANYVTLKGVDHGETVLALPFRSIDRIRMTDVLLKMVLEKIR